MWLEKDRQRIIEQDEIEDYWVSTIFIGLNQQFDPKSPPLCFETMIFTERKKMVRGKLRREEVGYQRRYTTLAEAKSGHMEAINWLRVEKLSRQNKPAPQNE